MWSAVLWSRNVRDSRSPGCSERAEAADCKLLELTEERNLCAFHPRDFGIPQMSVNDMRAGEPGLRWDAGKSLIASSMTLVAIGLLVLKRRRCSCRAFDGKG